MSHFHKNYHVKNFLKFSLQATKHMSKSQIGHHK